MTLVGKMFIVSILLMSVVFMGFALTVYSAHRNWREYVENTDAAGGKPLGLKPQLAALQEEKATVETELQNVQKKLAAEKAAVRQQLGKLEAERQELITQRDAAAKQLGEAEEANRALSASVDSTQQNLTRLTKEVEGLRTEIRTVQQDLDSKHSLVVSTTDELHGTVGKFTILKEREKQLTDMVARLTQKMAALSIDPNAEVSAVAPRVEGEVTGIHQNDLIEISIGSDDGLQAGHTVEIFRTGQAYLGRAEIIRTDPDRSVAKILKDFTRQGTVQRGDRVATRL